MFIVTVKSIDADSFASPALYGETTVQNYNFSKNPQGYARFFFLGQGPAGMSCRPKGGHLCLRLALYVLSS